MPRLALRCIISPILCTNFVPKLRKIPYNAPKHILHIFMQARHSDTVASNTMPMISLAPMIDWTDKDFRAFIYLFNPLALLYTEMISTSAILHGNALRHLSHYGEGRHILQLGGSVPSELGKCANIARHHNYHGLNLNVGCPSARVQNYEIGACLMKNAHKVGECVDAMAQSGLAVSVKHRIGVDNFDSYDFMADFVGTVARYGCREFIVHARIAWLQGLSPKQNRDIPPLRYIDVYKLKQDFPHLTIHINGGIDSLDAINTHLAHTDGVMIGRAAVQNPYLFAQSLALYGKEVPTRHAIFANFLQMLHHRPIVHRHYMGMFNGLHGARVWRQALTDKADLPTLDKIGNTILAQND